MAAYVHLCSCGLRRPQHFCPANADYTLQDAMELALSTEGIDGVVLDPWSHSATLDGALLNGLLHAGHTPEDPGDEKADAGKEAARKGNWAQAVECFEKAAELGSAMGLALLADCIYKGRGTRTNRAKARRMWKEAADSGEILSNIALGDDCAARGDNGRALLYYRRARSNAAHMPDIEYTRRCACVWPRPKRATPAAKRRWHWPQKQGRALPSSP